MMQGHLLAEASESALVLCLFCVGLRLPQPPDWARLLAALRLASITLLASVLLLAGCATVFLGMSFEHALLLGAVLAPTDPMLAGDLRGRASDEAGAAHAGLTTEAALSDVLVLPAVLFALAACGHYDAGPMGLRWFLLDVLWALPAGLVLGGYLGRLAARTLRALEWQGQVGYIEALLLLSVIALAYGGALALHANGLLAVLAAGYATAEARRRRRTLAPVPPARALDGMALRAERTCALAMLVVLGVLASAAELRATLFLFALPVLIGLRVLAARLAVLQLRVPESARAVSGCFGSRGVASIYYLLFALGSGLSADFAGELAASALAVLATAVALQGLTSLPLISQPLDQEG